MRKKILVTGGTGGIGTACIKLLKNLYDIDYPTRQELDFLKFDDVSNYDTSPYDIIINCAGNNRGTYQGFKNNSDINQVEQINVNYISPLLLLKNYISSRQDGQFIYMSSPSINNPQMYNIVYSGSKLALKYSLDTISKNTDFLLSEIVVGKTKSTMLYQNFCGTKTIEEVNEMYDEEPHFTTEFVALLIKECIDKKLSHISAMPC